MGPEKTSRWLKILSACTFVCFFYNSSFDFFLLLLPLLSRQTQRQSVKSAQCLQFVGAGFRDVLFARTESGDSRAFRTNVGLKIGEIGSAKLLEQKLFVRFFFSHLLLLLLLCSLVAQSSKKRHSFRTFALRLSSSLAHLFLSLSSVSLGLSSVSSLRRTKSSSVWYF